MAKPNITSDLIVNLFSVFIFDLPVKSSTKECFFITNRSSYMNVYFVDICMEGILKADNTNTKVTTGIKAFM